VPTSVYVSFFGLFRQGYFNFKTERLKLFHLISFNYRAELSGLQGLKFGAYKTRPNKNSVKASF